MAAELTSEQVWREVAKRSFAVLGFVTSRGAARTAGIVYLVRDRELYITTGRDSWKARHIAADPRVSLTVTIPKRIPFMPWIHIPDATITFQGEASVHPAKDVPQEIPRTLLHGLDLGEHGLEEIAVIRVRPVGNFVTYGIGVSLQTMRNPEAASGRAPV